MASVKVYPKNVNAYYRIHTTNVAGVDTIQGTSSYSVPWNDTITKGDNIPGWRDKLRRGENVTTQLGVVGNTIRVKRGFLIEKRKLASPPVPSDTASWTMKGDFGLSYTFGGNPSSLSTGTANNRALGRFLEQIRSVNTTFQGGVFFGEIAQTIHGIRNPAQGLRKLVTSYHQAARKLRSVEGFRVLRIPFEKHLAELWLEHSFHWLPLIHDINDAARTLSEFLIHEESRPKSKPVRATGTSESNVVSSAAGQSNGGLQWLTHETSKGKVTVVFRGAVRVNPRNSVSMAPELLGFNPGSFLPTIWELMPYSFLIDYFTNIGDIVNGWSLWSTNLMWSNQTVIKESIIERTASSKQALWKNDLSHASFSFSAPSVTCTRREISRSTYSGTFVPTLEFEIPGLGSKKWLNIAALAIARSVDLKFRF